MVLFFLANTAFAMNVDHSDIKQFSQNQRKKFDAKNHPKAKKINLTIEYPASWVAKEGERPNIVQKFSKKDQSNKFIEVSLMIFDVPNETPLNDISCKDILNEMYKTLKHIKSEKTKLENEEAAWGIFVQENERAGIKIKAKQVIFLVLYKDKLIQISGAVAGEAKDQTIEKEFELYLPLFIRIANSLVLQDKWKFKNVEG